MIRKNSDVKIDAERKKTDTQRADLFNLTERKPLGDLTFFLFGDEFAAPVVRSDIGPMGLFVAFRGRRCISTAFALAVVEKLTSCALHFETPT